MLHAVIVQPHRVIKLCTRSTAVLCARYHRSDQPVQQQRTIRSVWCQLQVRFAQSPTVRRPGPSSLRRNMSLLSDVHRELIAWNTQSTGDTSCADLHSHLNQQGCEGLDSNSSNRSTSAVRSVKIFRSQFAKFGCAVGDVATWASQLARNSNCMQSAHF